MSVERGEQHPAGWVYEWTRLECPECHQNISAYRSTRTTVLDVFGAASRTTVKGVWVLIPHTRPDHPWVATLKRFLPWTSPRLCAGSRKEVA